MSRKAGDDQSTWKTQSVYAFVGEYGPFRTKGYDAIDNALVWLCNTSTFSNHEATRRHPMFSMASAAQQVLVTQKNSDSSSSNNKNNSISTIVVVDLQSMFDTQEEYEESISNEIEETELTKMYGKKLLRLFQRLLLNNVIVAAEKELCAVLVKLYQSIQKSNENMIQELWLFQPDISTTFVNTHLVSTSNDKDGKGIKFPARMNIVTEEDGANSNKKEDDTNANKNEDDNQLNKKKKNKNKNKNKHKMKNRGGVLGHFFVMDKILSFPKIHNSFSIIIHNQDPDAPPPTYDPEHCNHLGKMLFLSQIKVEMNKKTKQYERNCTDITSDLLQIVQSKEDSANNHTNLNWSACPRQVGALILRGNRCVLVRSLEQSWSGMRIPTVVLKSDHESPHDAAIRAVVELADVEATQVQALPPHILPIPMYTANGLVQLYPLYATGPPPPGSEENDDEDEEDPYDWYTFPNALKRLSDDKASVVALQMMALNLVQAANVGLVPIKWGGVFGQELCNDKRFQ